jgi:(5-formylfuran-3-yl)methyl phosphate synthase
VDNAVTARTDSATPEPPDFLPHPRLLVSVRNAAECRAALAGGCDILDVKEPARGSLGMADRAVIADVLAAARDCVTGLSELGDGPVPVSAALGETVEWIASDETPALPPGLAWVKLGPAGLGSDRGWSRVWRQVRARIEEASSCSFRWIAVAYADWRDADAPEPAAVVDAAAESGCAGVLFDTCVKNGRTLPDLISTADLTVLGTRVRDAGLLLALAGGLSAKSLPALAGVRPDVIAIRTAACRNGNRAAEVAADAVREFRSAIEGLGITR